MTYIFCTKPNFTISIHAPKDKKLNPSTSLDADDSIIIKDQSRDLNFEADYPTSPSYQLTVEIQLINFFNNKTSAGDLIN